MGGRQIYRQASKHESVGTFGRRAGRNTSSQSFKMTPKQTGRYDIGRQKETKFTTLKAKIEPPKRLVIYSQSIRNIMRSLSYGFR